MAKLTKQQIKDHETACGLLDKDRLTEEDKDFVFEHWHEGATQMNAKAGAFFTPPTLAFDMEFDISGKRVIDLCAGIGVLSYAVITRSKYSYDNGEAPEIVCVEINPALRVRSLNTRFWILHPVWLITEPSLSRRCRQRFVILEAFNSATTTQTRQTVFPTRPESRWIAGLALIPRFIGTTGKT